MSLVRFQIDAALSDLRNAARRIRMAEEHAQERRQPSKSGLTQFRESIDSLVTRGEDFRARLHDRPE